MLYPGIEQRGMGDLRFNDDARLTVDVSMKRFDLLSNSFIWQSVGKSFSENVLITKGRKSQHMIEVSNTFSCNQTFVAWMLSVCLCHHAITRLLTF